MSISKKAPTLQEVPLALRPNDADTGSPIDATLAWVIRDFIADTHRRINALESYIDLFSSPRMYPSTGDKLYAAGLRQDLRELRESLRLTMSTGSTATRRRYDEGSIKRDEVKP